jgi:hypothetical protein
MLPRTVVLRTYMNSVCFQKAQTYRHICTEPGCVGAYGSEPDMRAHMRFHLIDFGHSCRDCKMRFLSRRGLEEHNMRHNMVESHNCDICNSVFYNSSALMRHMEIHIVSKRRSCYKVVRTFRPISRLRTVLVFPKQIFYNDKSD